MGIKWAKMSKHQHEIKDGSTNVRHKHIIKSDQDMTSSEYNMNHTHRGVALIFNHQEFKSTLKLNERSNTDKDVDALKECLPLLGFESDHIIVETDLTQAKILRYPYKILNDKSKIFDNCDCIAVFILTHGAKGNRFYAYDDDFDIHDLIKHYIPTIFNELAGKPKLFFINASRDISAGVLLTNKDCKDEGNDDQCEVTYPAHADLLISMSSHQEHTSISDQDGSWYIQDLCNSIRYFSNHNKLDTSDIAELLMYTHYLVSQRKTDDKSLKQTPNYSSALCRKVYFKTRKNN